MVSNTITLSTAGLSTQEGTVVGVAANLLAALDFSFRVLEAGDLSGEIMLINPASDVGREALSQLGDGQRALLVVDNEDAGSSGHFRVVRPLRVQTLLDALTEQVAYVRPIGGKAVIPATAAKSAVATPQGRTPAVAQSSSGPLPLTLFYLLLNAMHHHSLVRVVCSGGSLLLIHGPTQTVYTRADGMSLEKMAQQSGDTLKAERLSESDFMQATKGMSLTRMHDVIWLAERYGSRGQLLPGHSLDVPVQLRIWPKFNNRHVQPENLKLAALLSKHPITLRNLAEVSGVEMPLVIDFYNASVAFGVIEKQESAPQVVLAKPAQSGGLLGRIARRLALKRD